MNKFLARALVALACIPLIASAWVFVPPPRPAVAQFVDQSTWGGTSAGTANAQTITIANYGAHTAGVVLRFIPGNTNTGPTTINVSTLGNVAVQRPSSIGNVAFSGGEFTAGELTCIVYTGSVYQLGCNIDLTPIGRTVDFRGPTAPRGTLIEDGSAVSRTTYAPLFAVIGTTYGVGDGSTTFNVPDSRGTMFAALDNQGVNGSAGRITNAGSGCTATAVGQCGTQNFTLLGRYLPSITTTNTGIILTTTSGVTSVPQAGSLNASTFGNGGTGVNGWVPGALGALDTHINANALALTSNNTGTGCPGSCVIGNTADPHPVLNPILLGRRSIKY